MRNINFFLPWLTAFCFSLFRLSYLTSDKSHSTLFFYDLFTLPGNYV